MRILFLAGRELNYPRNDVILRALRRWAHVDVINVDHYRSLVIRSVLIFLRSIPTIITGRHDLIVVGFYGQILMLLLAIFPRKKILFDAFLSTYDTLCFDRKVFDPKSLMGRLTYLLDKASCSLADKVLLDTQEQVNYFQATFGIHPEKIGSLPVGCNEDLFHPRDGVEASPSNQTEVFFYSTYQPLHGVGTIIQAAKLLEDLSISIRIVGSGPDYARARSLAVELDASNVIFEPRTSIEDLALKIAGADICLGGPFGYSGKANRVFPGKVYQFLASSKATIVADTDAISKILQHKETAYFCQPNDSVSLAEAIKALHRDRALRECIADKGRDFYLSNLSEHIITSELRSFVEAMDLQPR